MPFKRSLALKRAQRLGGVRGFNSSRRLGYPEGLFHIIKGATKYGASVVTPARVVKFKAGAKLVGVGAVAAGTSLYTADLALGRGFPEMDFSIIGFAYGMAKKGVPQSREVFSQQMGEFGHSFKDKPALEEWKRVPPRGVANWWQIKQGTPKPPGSPPS